ncbi:cell wall-binding repeat-containing protein [Conexibacter sp. DBS9H8]|uniref:cell wall-binding repeat-containing protein n=1 Tax=Conexibacter sp. DBS9H8 TaxID=2937801 RepID=UPI00200E7E8A|nr:cell wall-binding repeat-containing protein [Conexibacter sp. DBS9H8]
MRRPRARATASAAALLLAVALGGCGSTDLLGHGAHRRSSATATTVATVGHSVAAGGGDVGRQTAAQLGFPDLATKNTTRVPGADAVSDAAAVALAVDPSTAPGTHPQAVTLAPTDDWQAALAAASLMGAPFRAPMLLSPASGLPVATANALGLLAPAGAPSLGGTQAVLVGDVPAPPHLRSVRISGGSPYAIAANIDAYEAARRGRESIDVVVASAQTPADAMPAAGWAAESGEPLLYVNAAGVPAVTAAALRRHRHPHIYVLGPASAIPDAVLSTLAHYGTVRRISGATAPAESVAFAEYRDPACVYGQPCAHVPRSFGWAIRSPGHGYVFLNAHNPLSAAAAAALSASGSFGPQLLLSNARTLPSPVLNYLLDFATPGYSSEGPTAAVYNHAWLIGNLGAVSASVQAQIDSILEVVPAK